MSWVLFGNATVLNNGTTQPTIQLPANTPAGAFIFIETTLYNRNVTMAAPKSGSNAYTPIFPASPTYFGLHGRIAGSSEPNPVVASANGYQEVSCSVWQWTGGTPPASIAALLNSNAPFTVDGASTNTWAYPELPKPSADGCLCFAIGSASGSTGSIADAGAYPTHIDQQSLNTAHPISTIWNALVQTTAAAIPAGTWAVTAGASVFPAVIVVALNPGQTASNAPAISGLSSNTVTPQTTNLVISGTNFGSATGSVALVYGTGPGQITSSCPVQSWSPTSVTVNIAQGNVPYGPLSLKLTTSGAQSATTPITLGAASGVSVTNAGALINNQFDALYKPLRLYDTPVDCPNNCQFDFWVTIGTGSLTVDTRGVVQWQPTVLQFQWRYWNGTVWSPVFTWDVTGPFPVNVTNFPNRSFTQSQPIPAPAIDFSTGFTEADPSELPLTYALAPGSGPLPPGTNLTGSVLSGTPTTVGSYPISIAAINADNAGNPAVGVAVTQPITYTVNAAPNSVAFNGPVPTPQTGTQNQPFVPLNLAQYFNYATSYALTSGTLPPGLTLDPVLGVISGTPTGTGTFPGLIVTGSNTTPSSAPTNPFEIDIEAVPTQATVPAVSYGAGILISQQLAVLACLTAGLAVATTNAQSSVVPVGDVIGQNYAPGTQVPFQTVITLVISATIGPAPSPPPTGSAVPGNVVEHSAGPINDVSQYWGGDLALTNVADLALSQQIALGQQRILRRLLTNPGDYIFQPNYGAGLPGYIGQPLDVAKMQALILAQMQLENCVAQQPTPVVTVGPATTPTNVSAVAVSISYTDAPSGVPTVLSFTLTPPSTTQ